MILLASTFIAPPEQKTVGKSSLPAAMNMPGTTSSNPLISEAVSVSSLAGITGSASGGLSIALGALGEVYLKEAQALDISPEIFVAALPCFISPSPA